MTEKSYATNVWMILGVSVVLLLFIFLLVGHHHDVPDRVRVNRGALLGPGSGVAEQVKPATQINVPSAETQREPVRPKAGTQR
jgi:hypothetical protein